MRNYTNMLSYNDRQDKKLSKKLKEAAPKLFKGAWKCEESNVWCIGGGVDYWGEGLDAYSCFEWIYKNYEYFGDFPVYPEGHKFEGFSDTTGFNPKFRNLLKLAIKHG